MAEKFPVKVQSLRLRQSLSLWERWHGVSRDGEGEDVYGGKSPSVKRQFWKIRRFSRIAKL